MQERFSSSGKCFKREIYVTFSVNELGMKKKRRRDGEQIKRVRDKIHTRVFNE